VGVGWLGRNQLARLPSHESELTGQGESDRRETFRVARGGFAITLGHVSDVTQILERVEQGDPKAADELLALVYEDLRRLAAHRMSNEAQGHTLQPTALVHEAWLRLAGKDGNAQFLNRAHFFAAAAEAMRRILIDRARRKRAVRHGGDQQRVDLQEVDLASTTDDDQLLAVSEALDKLAAEHKIEAELVKLRYFVGMTNEEAAAALDISPRTAKYYWTHARAWLFNEISRESKTK
jgi:RNA polymerase sigma factor (TIGR02999 family)